MQVKRNIDDDNAEFQLVPEIVKLWTQDAPIFLDEEGIANLGQWVAKHPGALLICDSLATLNGPLGLKENDPSPLALDAFSSSCCVYDMIYNPSKTALTKDAGARGLRASTGLGMLVWQGARSLAIWTGLKRVKGEKTEAFFAKVMRDAADAALTGE